MLIKKKPNIVNRENALIFKDEKIFSDFIKVMKRTNFNMEMFYINLNGIKLEEVNRFYKNKKIFLAEYDMFSNTIRYLKDDFYYGIMHELFHMGSTYLDGLFLYSGFFQENLVTGESIGIGLTEAYTMILDKRYFPDYSSKKLDVIGNDYVVTSYFVSMIESVVGETIMEKLYSEMDILGLVSILIPLTSKKETFKFLRALDFITINFEGKRGFLVTKEILNQISYASCYVCKLMINYSKKLRDQGVMTQEDYVEMIDAIAGQFSHPIVIGDYFKRKSQPINKDLVYKKAGVTKSL